MSLSSGSAPPGLTEKQVHSAYNTVAMLSVLCVFSAAAVLCFAIRVYAKLLLRKRMAWDDATCCLGLIGGLVDVICFAVSAVAGPFGKHIWNTKLSEFSSMSVGIAEYVLQVTTTPSLGLIKLTGFLFYYQLFRPLTWVRYTVWIGSTLSSLFYLTFTILQFYCMTPRPGESFGTHFTRPMTTIVTTFSLPTSSVGLAIDILLLIIPIVAIVQLQMARQRKIRLVLGFMVGIGAVMGSVLSLVFKIKTYHKPDFSYNFAMVNFFVISEMLLGICITCTPLISGAVGRLQPTVADKMRSIRTSVQHLRSNLLTKLSLSSTRSRSSLPLDEPRPQMASSRPYSSDKSLRKSSSSASEQLSRTEKE